MHPLMPALAGAVLAVVVIGIALRRFRQPLVAAYLLAGVLLGPHASGVLTDTSVLESLGALGVVLLLFFAGMEIRPEALLARWRVGLVGTALQVGGSVGCVALLGSWLDWPWARTVLLGFVISLSSTAVVLRLLDADRGADEGLRQDLTSVLLSQDLAVVPMMIVLGLFQGEEVRGGTLLLQLVGAAGTAALLVAVLRADRLRLPFASHFEDDPELQVFGALLFCFGLAVISSLLHLSAALGAFLGGMLVGSAHQTRSFHEHLKPFEVVFVAAFFVSVGMLIDLEFLRAHGPFVLGLVGLVFVTNQGINAVVLRVSGSPWKRSLVGASYLAQVGEFSFVLALVGHQSGIIGDFAYQATLSMISISLLVSPLWIGATRRLCR